MCADSTIRKQGLFSIGSIAFVSILSWITYGSLQGVLGSLAFLFIGLLFVFPWLIPFIGIPLGIIDFLGIWGFRMYDVVLTWAHVTPSWITVTFYWIMVVLSTIIQLVLDLVLIGNMKRSKNKESPKKTNFALVNCNIIDGDKDSEVLENGVILVKNNVGEHEKSGVITAVGKKGDIEIPADYEQIDLGGKYVLPGLIQSHCHLTGTGKPMKLFQLSDETMTKIVGLLRFKIMRKIILNAMTSSATTALNAGVTTIRTAGDPGYVDVELRDLIEEGKVVGPRLMVATQPLCITGGHGAYLGFVADSKVEVRKAIRQNLRKRADCIKLISTGGVMDARKIGEAGRPQMTTEEIEVATFEAHRGNLIVASHCESEKGMEEALEGGVDTIEHGSYISEKSLTLFRDNPKSLRGWSAVTPTIAAGMALAVLPCDMTKITWESYENAKLIVKGSVAGLRTAYKEGLRIGVGTDASVPYSTHYDLWKELKYFMHYTGMSAKEAIWYGTKSNAEILGLDDITGSIEVGKFADLQVVEENPLENIDSLGNVKMVVARGNLIKNPKIKKIKVLEENPLPHLLDV